MNMTYTDLTRLLDRIFKNTPVVFKHSEFTDVLTVSLVEDDELLFFLELQVTDALKRKDILEQFIEQVIWAGVQHARNRKLNLS